MTNTKNILIADRYANALIEIAKEAKLTFDKITSDLETIHSILQQSPDLNEFLTNPIVSNEDKKEIINKVFSNEIDILIVNFLKVLVDKDRFLSFNEIIDSYNKSLDNINNIKRVEVTSAVEMTADSKARLKNKLETKLKANVILDLNINTSIIAGLVIKIGDNVIDMSLKNKLEDLSKSITR